MGAWGVSILSNDIAEDISFIYKDLLGDKYSNEDASKIVINEFLNDLDDDEITTFWLSLALIQWKLGRLQEDVKTKALHIIESGIDLEHWEEDLKVKKKREVVLLKLKDQLNSPQPETKKVRKRFVSETKLKAKDAISYQLKSGDFIILKVIGIIEEWTGNRYPLFELCDWKGKNIPPREAINKLKIKKEIYSVNEQISNKIAIFTSGKRDHPTKRMNLVAENVNIVMDMETPYTLISWKEFDKYLSANYNFK